MIGIVGMLQWQKHLLVVEQFVVRFLGVHLLFKQYALCRIFHNNRTDDTREENHHHNTIKHVGIYNIRTIRQFHLHTNHCHGDTTRSMSLCKTKHHVSAEPRIPEYQT